MQTTSRRRVAVVRTQPICGQPLAVVDVNDDCGDDFANNGVDAATSANASTSAWGRMSLSDNDSLAFGKFCFLNPLHDLSLRVSDISLVNLCEMSDTPSVSRK